MGNDTLCPSARSVARSPPPSGPLVTIYVAKDMTEASLIKSFEDAVSQRCFFANALAPETSQTRLPALHKFCWSVASSQPGRGGLDLQSLLAQAFSLL